MIKYSHEKQNAIRLSVELKGNVQEYAMSFLQIFNNAREYPNMIYRVENNPGNTVYVTCNPEDVDAVRGFLSQFGEIENEEEIVKFVVNIETDTKGFEYIYGKPEDDPIDVEFYIGDE